MLSPLDHCITQFDRLLRTLAQGSVAARPNPANTQPFADLSPQEQRHAAGLMRVNHAGEVCAQALYQGQALTAKLAHTRQAMTKAADEEVDHLAWCEQRLQELGSRPSLLNPLWYGLSFGLGAAAGAIGDSISLGFVAATEEKVCQHLEGHLQSLPQQDEKSRTIVAAMLQDEAQHAQQALAAGGYPFPAPVKWGMALVAKAMTASSYRI